MGRLKKHRQVTLYVEPNLYERVRCAAYALSEDIYEFVDEALRSSLERRTTKAQRAALDLQAGMNRSKSITRAKTGGKHATRRWKVDDPSNGTRRTSRG